MERTTAVWARPTGTSKWCAIRELASLSSVVTYCDGRWEASSTVEVGVPDNADKCLLCALRSERAESPRVAARGLAPVEKRFDTSDVELVDFDDGDTLDGAK